MLQLLEGTPFSFGGKLGFFRAEMCNALEKRLVDLLKLLGDVMCSHKRGLRWMNTLKVTEFRPQSEPTVKFYLLDPPQSRAMDTVCGLRITTPLWGRGLRER